MKILYICQYFHPELARGNDIVFHWAEQGHDVHVVTCIPNYPKGKFYDGYGLFHKRHEVVNGVRVTHLPIIPRGSNRIMLALNYFSFLFVTWTYILFHALNHKYDFVFVLQLSPVTMSAPGVLYKRMRKVPLYTWVQDLWPESLTAAGGIKNKLILNYFAGFVKDEYKYSDKILISSRSFEKHVMGYGDYKDKIVYYPQWAEDVFHAKQEVTLPEMPNGFKVMFAGNMGEAQDFTHIVDAAELVRGTDIRFVIVGDGRKKAWVEEQVKSRHLEDNLILLGRYPVSYMPAFFEKADVMLVVLKNETIFNMTLPAKVQTYMMAGRPVIGMINGEGGEIIREAVCGLSVPAESPELLVAALKEMRNMSSEELGRMGENGRKYCLKYFQKDKCLQDLDKLIIEV